MDSIVKGLRHPHTPVCLQAVNRLYDLACEKKEEAVTALWTAVKVENAVVATECLDSLVRLVVHEHLNAVATIDTLVSLIPTLPDALFTAALHSLAQLLQYQNATQPVVYNFAAPCHPLLVIYKNRPESWPLLLDHCESTLASASAATLEALTPFLWYTLVCPSGDQTYACRRGVFGAVANAIRTRPADDSAKESLFQLLIKSLRFLPVDSATHVHWYVNAHKVLSKLAPLMPSMIDDNIAQLIQLLYSDTTQSTVIILEEIKRLLVYTSFERNSSLNYHTLALALASLLLNVAASTVPAVLDLISLLANTPLVTLSFLLYPLTTLVGKPYSDRSVALIKRIEGQLVTAAAPQSACEEGLELGVWGLFAVAFIKAMTSQNWVTIESLFASTPNASHHNLLAILLTGACCTANTNRHAAYLRLVKFIQMVPSNSPSLLNFMFYRLKTETDPEVHLTILHTMVDTALDSRSVGPVVACLDVVSKTIRLRALSLTLLTRLWQCQPRVFNRLLERIERDRDENGRVLNSDELIARAASVLTICQVNAGTSGVQMVPIISSIVEMCKVSTISTSTVIDGDSQIALALEALAILCDEDVVDPLSCWLALRTMLQHDTRPTVIKGVVRLLGCIGSQEVNDEELKEVNLEEESAAKMEEDNTSVVDEEANEQEKLADDAADYLWMHATDSASLPAVVASCLKSLSRFVVHRVVASFGRTQLVEVLPEETAPLLIRHQFVEKLSSFFVSPSLLVGEAAVALASRVLQVEINTMPRRLLIVGELTSVGRASQAVAADSRVSQFSLSDWTTSVALKLRNDKQNGTWVGTGVGFPLLLLTASPLGPRSLTTWATAPASLLGKVTRLVIDLIEDVRISPNDWLARSLFHRSWIDAVTNIFRFLLSSINPTQTAAELSAHLHSAIVASSGTNETPQRAANRLCALTGLALASGLGHEIEAIQSTLLSSASAVALSTEERASAVACLGTILARHPSATRDSVVEQCGRWSHATDEDLRAFHAALALGEICSTWLHDGHDQSLALRSLSYLADLVTGGGGGVDARSQLNGTTGAIMALATIPPNELTRLNSVRRHLEQASSTSVSALVVRIVHASPNFHHLASAVNQWDLKVDPLLHWASTVTHVKDEHKSILRMCESRNANERAAGAFSLGAILLGEYVKGGDSVVSMSIAAQLETMTLSDTDPSVRRQAGMALAWTILQMCYHDQHQSASSSLSQSGSGGHDRGLQWEQLPEEYLLRHLCRVLVSLTPPATTANILQCFSSASRLPPLNWSKLFHSCLNQPAVLRFVLQLGAQPTTAPQVSGIIGDLLVRKRWQGLPSDLLAVFLSGLVALSLSMTGTEVSTLVLPALTSVFQRNSPHHSLQLQIIQSVSKHLSQTKPDSVPSSLKTCAQAIFTALMDCYPIAGVMTMAPAVRDCVREMAAFVPTLLQPVIRKGQAASDSSLWNVHLALAACQEYGESSQSLIFMVRTWLLDQPSCLQVVQLWLPLAAALKVSLTTFVARQKFLLDTMALIAAEKNKLEGIHLLCCMLSAWQHIESIVEPASLHRMLPILLHTECSKSGWQMDVDKMIRRLVILTQCEELQDLARDCLCKFRHASVLQRQQNFLAYAIP